MDLLKADDKKGNEILDNLKEHVWNYINCKNVDLRKTCGTVKNIKNSIQEPFRKKTLHKLLNVYVQRGIAKESKTKRKAVFCKRGLQ